MEIHRVKDLTLGLCEDKFFVKIVRKFEQSYPYGLVREFIFSDSTGNHIQGTVLPGIDFDTSMMHEGDSFELSRFLVNLPSIPFWNTSSICKMYFGDFTTHRRVESITESTCIRYNQFSWLHSPNFLCITRIAHVVGRIQHIEDVAMEMTATTMGTMESVHVLKFVLMDRELLLCKAVGKYVGYFDGLRANHRRDGGTYCELRFWRVASDDDDVTLVSSFDGVSDVVINPRVSDVMRSSM